MLLVSHTGLSHAHAAASQESTLLPVCQAGRGGCSLRGCWVLRASAPLPARRAHVPVLLPAALHAAHLLWCLPGPVWCVCLAAGTNKHLTSSILSATCRPDLQGLPCRPGVPVLIACFTSARTVKETMQTSLNRESKVLEVVQGQLSWCLQGLTLNEPEVVPFRLTQNMIDAFGVAGVEGVFRKTCEVSLEVSSLLCKGASPCSPCFSGWTEGKRGTSKVCQLPSASADMPSLSTPQQQPEPHLLHALVP